jgi:hypothetical protein
MELQPNLFGPSLTVKPLNKCEKRKLDVNFAHFKGGGAQKTSFFKPLIVLV